MRLISVNLGVLDMEKVWETLEVNKEFDLVQLCKCGTESCAWRNDYNTKLRAGQHRERERERGGSRLITHWGHHACDAAAACSLQMTPSQCKGNMSYYYAVLLVKDNDANERTRRGNSLSLPNARRRLRHGTEGPTQQTNCTLLLVDFWSSD